MHTGIADKYKRGRLPDAKPKQVFAYANSGETITLTPVKANKAKPRFPKGSLLKYLTPERDKEQLAILSGCVQTPLDSFSSATEAILRLRLGDLS